MPAEDWGHGVYIAARRHATEALREVGSGQTVETVKGFLLHARRSLSDEEMGRLTAEWLAIPAQDEFMEGCEMETRL
jgi:hypothetical protein